MWGIGNCLSHHGPACHRVTVISPLPCLLRLGTLAWQDIKASVEYFDTFQRQTHGIPRHPPKLWAPAASLSSMTSMSSSDRILPHFGECLRRVLSIGICQGTAFQQILWASWVEASEAQVPPVPPVPGCSQSQFTEFTEFTEFTVRVPQRNRSASFQSFHSFFSFTSFSSDSFDSFDSFLSLGLLGLRLTK